MEKKEILPVDATHRVLMQKIYANGRWGWYVAMQERFLWFWTTLHLVNDGWDRIHGYSSEKEAKEEAESAKALFLEAD